MSVASNNRTLLPKSGCTVFFPHPHGAFMSIEMAIALAERNENQEAVDNLRAYREKYLKDRGDRSQG